MLSPDPADQESFSNGSCRMILEGYYAGGGLEFGFPRLKCKAELKEVSKWGRR